MNKYYLLFMHWKMLTLCWSLCCPHFCSFNICTVVVFYIQIVSLPLRSWQERFEDLDIILEIW